MKKAKIGFALVALGALVLGACDSSTNGGTPVAAGDLVGTWYYRKAVTTGTMHMKGDFGPFQVDTTMNLDSTQTFTGTQYYIDFKADSTYTANSPDVTPTPDAGPKRSAAAAVENGRWWVNGNALTTVSSEMDTTTLDVALSGSTLTGILNVDSSFSDSGFTMAIKMKATMTLSKQ